MEIYLAEQTLVFLQAIVVGMLLALLFDAFRISRIALPTPAWVVFVEDVLFFFLCAVATFVLMLRTLEGQVRVFVLIGEILGVIAYTLTVGKLVMGVSKTIIRIIHGILWFVFRWFIRPLWRLFYYILALLLRPFYFLMGKTKKSMQRWKFRLKVKRLLVYNHCKDYLLTKRKITGEQKADETEGAQS